MEVQHIIKAGEISPLHPDTDEGPFLNISEFFFDTIQGEGKFLGTPAAFLRLQGCPVNCKWCDTAAVWKKGVRVSISWLLRRMEETGLKDKLADSFRVYHLVVTGGSPLLQQAALDKLFERMNDWWGFTPFIEVENECSLVAGPEIIKYVSAWNNSPKLSNSGVPEERRYNPKAFVSLYGRPCIYKFVVKDEEDWQEIEEKYIKPGYVRKDSIVLMPMGASQKEYFENREKVVELAVRHGVQYSPREHIAIWDKKTGI